MKIVIIIAFFLFLGLQQTTIIASSPSNTIITSPPSQSVVVNPLHNTNNPNYISNGALWISKNGGDVVPAGQNITFQAKFYSDCGNPAKLLITADNTFSASLNGGSPMTGKNWLKVYFFDISLKCGINTLTITVINTDPNTAIALIFAITQDQTGCYQCKTPLASYNYDTCKCQCNGRCDCKASNPLFIWLDYPYCGCSCGKLLQCGQYQFFNKKTCRCQCKKKVCPPKQVQDPKSCQCVKTCGPKICPPPFKWSEQNCQCNRPGCDKTEQDCPMGQFDRYLCTCVGSYIDNMN